jgi:hypothetical protein
MCETQGIGGSQSPPLKKPKEGKRKRKTKKRRKAKKRNRKGEK